MATPHLSITSTCTLQSDYLLLSPRKLRPSRQRLKSIISVARRGLFLKVPAVALWPP